MKKLIIKIDPESLPIHNAILFVNNERIPINQSTDLQLKLNLEENYLRINDAGIRLKPIKIIVFEGETKYVLIGLKKGNTSLKDKNITSQIWLIIKRALDFDLEFYLRTALT